MFEYKYEMPSLTVDVVVVDDNDNILLIKRGGDFEKGKWALPGGFVNKLERTLHAAQRELQEETGLLVPASSFCLVTVADKPTRDPRGWVVSIVYAAYVEDLYDIEGLKAADDADDYKIINAYEAEKLELAFDHKDIIDELVRGIPYQPCPVGLE